MNVAKRLPIAAALLAAIACIMHLPSCGADDGAHTYVGYLYNATLDCVFEQTTIDVVSGDDPGDCDPVCMVQPLAEGGKSVYVATMCAPYPQPDFDFSGTNPECPPALAALARKDVCLDDGAVTGPLAPDASEAGDGDASDGD